MKITQNFKNRLKKAQIKGYKRVYVIVGAYKATTYCVFHKIDTLLNEPIGYDYGNQKPYNTQNMWTGHPNTRMVEYSTDIKYSDVF